MNGPPLDRQGALDWLAQQRVGTVDTERWIEESDLRAAALNGLTSLNQVRRVLDDLKQALADGKEFSEWRDAYQFDMPASRLDLIVRNHVQAATVAGRFEAALASGDYLMFVTTKDDRVTTPCRIRDGMIRHSTDPSLQGSIPPLHANCRCTLVRLTPEQAWLRSRNNTGLFQDDPTIAADDGWGNSPQPLDPGIRDALKDALLDLPDQLRQAAAEYMKELLP